MAVFPATYFTFSTRYPESGSRMNLGRSYLYTVEPEGPDQRVFVIKVQGMQYFLTGAGLPDEVTEPGRNMWGFENFYIDHRMHTPFTFNHPVYGTLTCKFNRPLEIPEGIIGGDGTLPAFDVELIEIP